MMVKERAVLAAYRDENFTYASVSVSAVLLRDRIIGTKYVHLLCIVILLYLCCISKDSCLWKSGYLEAVNCQH